MYFGIICHSVKNSNLYLIRRTQGTNLVSENKDKPLIEIPNPFGDNIRIYKLTALLLILLFAAGALLYIGNQKTKDNLINQLFRPALIEQQEKFKLQHKKLAPVITAWNEVSDITDKKASSKLARTQIDSVLNKYETLKIDKLDASYRITWLWHLARLYIIHADKESDYMSIAKAKIALNEVQKIIDNINQYPKEIIQFADDRKISERIARTSLNAYALAYHIVGDQRDQDGAMMRVKEFDGCSGLENMNVSHKKILKALNCKIL